MKSRVLISNKKGEEYMKRCKSFKAGLSFLFVFLFVLPSAGLASEEKPYKVGVSMEITGGASFLGEPERNTLVMMEEQINKAGGINGHPVKLIIYDNGTDSTKHVMALKRLIEQDEVVAIIGPGTSGNTLAGIPIVEKAAVPTVSTASSIKIVEPVKKWVFNTANTDVINVKKILNHVRKLGLKKVAILYSDSGYGISAKETFDKIAPEMGFPIVASETFTDKDTDMTAQLTRIKASGAEAIFVATASPAGSIICKNYKQLGVSAKMYQSTGFASQQYVDLAGDAANGIFLAGGRFLVLDQLPSNSPYRPVLEKYKKEYESRFNLKVNEFGGQAHDAMMLVMNAMRKAGSDKAKIRDEIENTKNFLGVKGYFNMSPTNHNGLDERCLVMIEVMNKKFKFLEE
jgi:branched-chain amino acid transport system substrate-binding protein